MQHVLANNLCVHQHLRSRSSRDRRSTMASSAVTLNLSANQQMSSGSAQRRRRSKSESVLMHIRQAHGCPTLQARHSWGRRGGETASVTCITIPRPQCSIEKTPVCRHPSGDVWTTSDTCTAYQIPVRDRRMFFLSLQQLPR